MKKEWKIIIGMAVILVVSVSVFAYLLPDVLAQLGHSLRGQ